MVKNSARVNVPTVFSSKKWIFFGLEPVIFLPEIKITQRSNV